MFDNFRKRCALLGAVVIGFDSRGCMAEDHVFKWAGTVTGFKPNRYASESAVVKVHKRADDHRDSRDLDLGEEFPVASDTMLQKIGPSLFAYYK